MWIFNTIGFYIRDYFTAYVCINDNVVNKQPDLNTDIWKQDQCSKTLKGCLLRFQDYVVNYGIDNKALPFGAIPSTLSHENKQKNNLW